MIKEAHDLLDRLGVPDAKHLVSDDDRCNSRLTHRITLLSERAQTLTTDLPFATGKVESEAMVEAQIDAMAQVDIARVTALIARMQLRRDGPIHPDQRGQTPNLGPGYTTISDELINDVITFLSSIERKA